MSPAFQSRDTLSEYKHFDIFFHFPSENYFFFMMTQLLELDSRLVKHEICIILVTNFQKEQSKKKNVRIGMSASTLSWQMANVQTKTDLKFKETEDKIVNE